MQTQAEIVFPEKWKFCRKAKVHFCVLLGGEVVLDDSEEIIAMVKGACW
jgi:hypothetical protein